MNCTPRRILAQSRFLQAGRGGTCDTGPTLNHIARYARYGLKPVYPSRYQTELFRRVRQRGADMLTPYRRHLKKCPHRGKGRKYTKAAKCSCPLWCDGTLMER